MEIKFRVWDKKNKEMLYSDNGRDYLEINFYASYLRKNAIGDSYFLDLFELMQYIGLPDKKGKDIYVGDTLKIFVMRQNYECSSNLHHGGYYLKAEVLDVRGNLKYDQKEINELEEPKGREVYEQSVRYDNNLFDPYHCERIVEKNGKPVRDENDTCRNYKRYLDIEVI